MAIEKLFAKVTPDTVRLWTLSMTSVPQFDGAMGFERMDPRLADMAIRADPAKVGGWNAISAHSSIGLAESYNDLEGSLYQTAFQRVYNTIRAEDLAQLLTSTLDFYSREDRL